MDNSENKHIITSSSLPNVRQIVKKMAKNKGIAYQDILNAPVKKWAFINWLSNAGVFFKTKGYPRLDTLVKGLEEIGLSIQLVDTAPIYKISKEDNIIMLERLYYPRYRIYFNDLDDLSNFDVICYDTIPRTVERLRKIYNDSYIYYFKRAPRETLKKQVFREINKIIWNNDEESKIYKRFIIK